MLPFSDSLKTVKLLLAVTIRARCQHLGVGPWVHSGHFPLSCSVRRASEARWTPTSEEGEAFQCKQGQNILSTETSDPGNLHIRTSSPHSSHPTPAPTCKDAWTDTPESEPLSKLYALGSRLFLVTGPPGSGLASNREAPQLQGPDRTRQRIAQNVKR